MGNSSLSRELSSRKLSTEERESMKKFCEEEIQLLRETFKGLAYSKNGYAVDKETFLKCFPMPGLLGERLFEVIDKDGSGLIKFNEFVHGLAILFRGTHEEKLRFIFDLYDLSESGSISRRELVTMLNQFPQSALDVIQSKEDPATPLSSPRKQITMDDIEALVDRAFPDASSNRRLTFDQFCEWCESTPGIMNLLMSILPSEDLSPSSVTPVDTSTLQGADGALKKRRNSLKNLQPTANRKDLERSKQLLTDAKAICPVPAATAKIQQALHEIEVALNNLQAPAPLRVSSMTNLSHHASELSGKPSHADMDGTSGNLWKRGSRLRQMLKRHYVLQGSFLYYYANRDDAAPRGVTFLCGCYVESQVQNVIIEKNVKFYAIDIVPEPGSTREKRTIYAKSPEEQARWTTVLQQATDKVSIDEFYNIGPQLGRGRFSKVCEGVHKQSGIRHAVKIIDKSKLVATEKELLRTEIAILKLVKHPNIIELHDVYEDRQHIYIVTELVSGGELFNRIVGRSRYTETEARMVMMPLLESVAYLHRLGIVHRDIKPENILCGERLNDLKIADFGLSKLVHPEEIMKMPCGTLNYVAPEVLSLVGYGKEADIWSVGVIMFLLLRGELPFHGKTKNEIIQKTLHADINLEHDMAWSSISPSCKALLKGLLTKDPSKRLTAQDALRHDWFSPPRSRSNSLVMTSSNFMPIK
ncbi:TPA: hypothetical protein N0F65_005530 [Lagenidium giganteum]|uniref:non-specific serine/threonine protein kinase n=1 Tax=Lagenidium giganteum TaxID=4803 RepID=A0AAV2YVX8_9STRA|nr:TPA: hypothetical protein N0F65_005530 [Lagenidium giganteum]